MVFRGFYVVPCHNGTLDNRCTPHDRNDPYTVARKEPRHTRRSLHTHTTEWKQLKKCKTKTTRLLINDNTHLINNLYRSLNQSLHSSCDHHTQMYNCKHLFPHHSIITLTQDSSLGNKHCNFQYVSSYSAISPERAKPSPAQHEHREICIRCRAVL